MPDPNTIRLAVIRDICQREGHNWAEIGTCHDPRWIAARCARGCGATRTTPWSDMPVSPSAVIEALSGLDPHRTTIHAIEIVTEPADQTSHTDSPGQHEFAYDQHDPVFRCIHCGGRETVLRDPATGRYSSCPDATDEADAAEHG